MSTDDVTRAVRRMAHEILEKNHGCDDVMIVGMQTGGVELARAIAAAVADIEVRRCRPARSTPPCTETTLVCAR